MGIKPNKKYVIFVHASLRYLVILQTNYGSGFANPRIWRLAPCGETLCLCR